MVAGKRNSDYLVVMNVLMSLITWTPVAALTLGEPKGVPASKLVCAIVFLVVLLMLPAGLRAWFMRASDREFKYSLGGLMLFVAAASVFCAVCATLFANH